MTVLNQLGLPGIILLLIVCLIAFGSKNLPQIGRSMGESLKEFKNAFSNTPKEIRDRDQENQITPRNERQEG